MSLHILHLLSKNIIYKTTIIQHNKDVFTNVYANQGPRYW